MDFSNFNKNSSNAFHQQKALIKKVLAGKAVKCEKCGAVLKATLLEQGQISLCCNKGCTDILLDMN